MGGEGSEGEKSFRHSINPKLSLGPHLVVGRQAGSNEGLPLPITPPCTRVCPPPPSEVDRDKGAHARSGKGRPN